MALVAPDTPGVRISDEPGFDGAACRARVDFTAVVVPREMMFAEPGTVRAALAVGAVATAAEALGAAAAALEMAVTYSKERTQFGRQIGSFQALQHHMADLHVLCETATAAVLYASASLDTGADPRGETASIAKAHVSRASRRIVEGALQILGGIAFTWEHDVHLLQRRVLECERRFGDALHHEHVLAERIASPPVGA